MIKKFGVGLALTLGISLFVPQSAHAQLGTFYGIQNQSLLVSVSPFTAATSPIGALGAGFTGGTSFATMTYNPNNNQLYAVGYEFATDLYKLHQINPATGAVMGVFPLGVYSSVGAFEALEYVHSLNSMVLTRWAPAFGSLSLTRDLYSITTTGTMTSLGVTTAVPDNDAAAYDSKRGIFYSLDSSPTGFLADVNLSTGAAALHAAVPAGTWDGAYSDSLDELFATSNGTSLWKISATNVNGSFSPVGNFSGHVGAIAFRTTQTSAPEPGTLSLLALGIIGGMATRNRKGARA
ncbi:PEP-CTERM sorting domain-containing protein [Armatimonas sp.]|uniref:PEP-CTERM sorting domain-containing protein n=1 Tax=Armatimonas sp. TaxID=1872638 RepID=UPI0037514D35